MSEVLLDALVFTSLGLVGMGVFFRHRDRHILRASGYILFGLFWAFRVPDFLGSEDAINTVFVAMALPFFAFLGYRELLIYRGEPRSRGLEMLAGGVFFGGMVYFVMAKVPPVSGGIISMVTSNSTSLANMMGGEYTAGGLMYQGGGGWYIGGFSAGAGVLAPILRTDSTAVVYIEFACTGVQSILVFVGPILFATSTAIRTKLRAVVLITAIIYVLNLFRNAGIVTLIDKMDLSPSFAHDVVGKAGSIAALVLLAFLAFKLVPELLGDVDDLIGLFSHPTRRKQRSPPEEPSPPPPPSPPE